MLNKDSHKIACSVISDLAASKEKIIKDVLNKFFNNETWNEKVIAKNMMIQIDHDGSEELYIHNVLAIKFSRIRSNITVINESVVCTYMQDVQVF